MSKNRLSIVTASERAVAPVPGPEHASRSDSGRGKVVHDARGTAVWDWAIETGVLAKRTASDLLTTLEKGAPSLECEQDAPQSWSGDPYNRPAR